MNKILCRPSRDSARSVRFAVIGLVLVATAALAAPAIGFVSKRAQPPAVVNSALEQVAATKRQDGKNVGLWLAPTSVGGECLLLQVEGLPSRAPIGNAGRVCSKSGRVRQAAPIMAIVHWLPTADGRFDVLVSGRAAPESGITRVDMQNAVGSTALTTTRGYFLTSLGTTTQSGVLPDARAVVGYDPQGNEVTRVDLEQLLAASRPKS